MGVLRIIQRLIHGADIDGERRSHKGLELRHSKHEQLGLVVDVVLAVDEFLVAIPSHMAHRIYDIAFLENIQVTRIPAVVQRFNGDGVRLGLVSGVLVVLDLLGVLQALGLIAERLLTGLTLFLTVLERCLGILLGLSLGHPIDALLFGFLFLLELIDGRFFRRLALLHVLIVGVFFIVILLLLCGILRCGTNGVDCGVLVVRALSTGNIEDVLAVIDDLLIHLMNIRVQIKDKLIILIPQDQISTKGFQNVLFDGIGDRPWRG